MLPTFGAGIHPPANKSLSDKIEISQMPLGSKVYIPLSQHIGKPAIAVVAKGDSVKEGQLIGKADGAISANIFSSVAGNVVAIEDRPVRNGLCPHIVIEVDHERDESDRYDFAVPLGMDAEAEQIVERITYAGIVGMGGAGFPLGFKIATSKNVDTFIINGAECEPYITCDYRAMVEYSEDFLKGCVLLKRASCAERLIIGIEDNKPDCKQLLDEIIAKNNYDISVMMLKTKYPQGAEKQLVYSVTKRKVAPGKLPSSVGCIVCNVASALAVYNAVVLGMPLYKRIITVTGQAVGTPANLWVANGTLFQEIIDYCGGFTDDIAKFINGGPMMGTALESGNYSSTDTSSCLLCLSRDEAFLDNPEPCINCAKCASVCPMHLMPMFIDSYALAGDIDTAVKYGARNCMECGSCAYVCSANRPLVQSIRLAKKLDALRRAK